MKSKFFQISLGVTMMLFGLGFVIRSVTSLNAAPNPMPPVSVSGETTGKYMWAITPQTNDFLAIAMIWDTETGNCIRYVQKNDVWQKSASQIPENPWTK